MTGLIQAKGGGGERRTEIKDIEVPDLWHIAMRSMELGNTQDEKQILECWHLAHDMKKALQHIDKVLPIMLERATDRIKEYITDIQEMGDVEQRTVDNLRMWAAELQQFMSVFEYLPMDEEFMGDQRNDAEHYIEEALRLADEISGEIDEDDESDSVDNNYICPCGNEWTMTWSCACNDRCDDCGREIEPEVAS